MSTASNFLHAHVAHSTLNKAKCIKHKFWWQLTGLFSSEFLRPDSFVKPDIAVSMQPCAIPIQKIHNFSEYFLQTIVIYLLLLLNSVMFIAKMTKPLHTCTENMIILLITSCCFNSTCSLTNTRQSRQSWPGCGWGLRGQERLGVLSTLSSRVLQTVALPALHSQVPNTDQSSQSPQEGSKSQWNADMAHL